MSQGKFISRFLEAQKAKGNDLGLWTQTLEKLAQNEQEAAAASQPEAPAWKVTDEELATLTAPRLETKSEIFAAQWPAVRGGASPEAAPATATPARPGWLKDRAAGQAPRTVGELLQELKHHRPTSRDAAPAAPQVTHQFNPSDSLTACLDSAECPQTARKIFRLLHELGLESVRKRGLPTRPDIAVFHLPVELLAAHLQVERTTIWRNVQPLKEAGILDERDHYDTLRGQTAVTGKLWAISTMPELVLSGQNRRVRLTHADLRHQWRNLDRDVREGRTAYDLTRTEARKEADRASREAQAEERAAARARAEERKAEREAAKARGEKVLTGRAAATANAKETKAKKPRVKRPKSSLQQSLEGLKTVSKVQLLNWVLAPFSDLSSDVTLTVASGPAVRPLSGLDAVFTLPTLAELPKRDRNAAVEQTARALAASFEDTDNLRFWCWLLWQLIRGCDQGQNWTDDVAHLLARVLHDIKHDETLGSRCQNRPAALVVNALRNCGLLDALRALAPTRAGGRPQAPAPEPLLA